MTDAEITEIVEGLHLDIELDELGLVVARAIAAAERKACAKVATDYVQGFDREYAEVGQEIAGLIEERGQ